MWFSAGAVRWFATRFSAILAQLLAHLLVYIVLHSQVFFRVDVGVRVCDWYFFGGFFGVWIVCLSVCVCACVCEWNTLHCVDKGKRDVRAILCTYVNHGSVQFRRNRTCNQLVRE